MKVIVAEKYGFCPGVRNAISTAEKVLARQGRAGSLVYSLGPIIHNPNEVHRLAEAVVPIQEQVLGDVRG